MAITLMFVGAFLLATGLRGNAAQLISLFFGDIKSGLIYWFLVIAAIGLLGQIPALKQFSTYFLVLVILTLILSNKEGLTALANLEKEVGINQTGSGEAPETAGLPQLG